MSALNVAKDILLLLAQPYLVFTVSFEAWSAFRVQLRLHLEVEKSLYYRNGARTCETLPG